MKKSHLIFFTIVIGCGGSPKVGDPDAGHPPDGGVPDGGMPCENTVVAVALESTRAGLPWSHIPETEDPVYTNNPPVNGEHYELRWGQWAPSSTEVPRAYWVHNLEHGGVVFLYRPDAPQSIIDALLSAYNNATNDSVCVSAGFPHKRIVVTPDHLLPPDLPWAAVVADVQIDANNGHKVTGACVNVDILRAFAESRRGKSVEENCSPPP